MSQPPTPPVPAPDKPPPQDPQLSIRERLRRLEVTMMRERARAQRALASLEREVASLREENARLLDLVMDHQEGMERLAVGARAKSPQVDAPAEQG